MRPLPSPGVTRVHQYNEPLRHPKRPDLALAGCPLRVTRPHRWGFPCCVKVLCQRACVDYPGSRDGASVWRPSPGFRDVPWAIQKPGVPRSRGGSATAICIFEAHKTFTDVQACWLARSPKETTTPRASDVLSGLLPTTTPVVGWVCLPLDFHTFARRTRETASDGRCKRKEACQRRALSPCGSPPLAVSRSQRLSLRSPSTTRIFFHASVLPVPRVLLF